MLDLRGVCRLERSGRRHTPRGAFGSGDQGLVRLRLLCLRRKLSPFISRMWTWWVRRSSRAPVRRSEPSTSVHSAKGQVAGHERRAPLVALTEHLERAVRRRSSTPATKDVAGDPGLGERHEAQFVDDEQLVAGDLFLEAEQLLLVACLDQFVDQCCGGGEADAVAALTGGQAEGEREVRLAGAARYRNIMPIVRKTSRFTTSGHPLRGQDLRVRRRVQLPSGEYLFGEFPDGTIGGFPAWMTDPMICLACPTGSPMASAVALAELRALLDSIHSGSLGASSFLNEMPMESPHATKEDAGVDAAGTVVQPLEPPIALPVEKQRDLTAALADLLLDAAAARCSEPISGSRGRSRMHPKLTVELLQRRAVVYIRQSSAGQVAHNLESQRRQYGLADHARQLGFQRVQVIDEDLGRSGSGKWSDLDSNVSWPRSVLEMSVPCSASKHRAWPAMAGTGTISSNSVDWCAQSSSILMESTIRAFSTTACCWG